MTDYFAVSSDIFPQFGPLSIYVNVRGIYQIRFSPSNPSLKPPDQDPDGLNLLAKKAIDQLREYFTGNRRQFDLPIDWSQMIGFQHDVLKLTFEIPYGQTRTYGDIARKLGNPTGARAVGAAVGSNPIPIFIPCHRVVGSNGSLHGYSAPGGIETKAWLLQLEGARIIA
jgi:methylated-DNA-[protein]-cysteine S-methyltransferase